MGTSAVPTVGAPFCTKHRLGKLDLVGDEVQGTCAGCGDKVVVPSFPDASKLLIRVLGFSDRIMALVNLDPDDRRRAVVNLLPDFIELARVVELAEVDQGNVRGTLGILRAQIATFLARGE